MFLNLLSNIHDRTNGQFAFLIFCQILRHVNNWSGYMGRWVQTPKFGSIQPRTAMKLFRVHGYKFAQERGPLNFEAWSKLCWVLGTWVQISSSPKFGSIQAKSVMKLFWVHGYMGTNSEIWLNLTQMGNEIVPGTWVHGYILQNLAQSNAEQQWNYSGYMGTNLLKREGL